MKSAAVFLIALGMFTIHECQTAECQEKLGMASGIIKDNQISASSFYGTHQPKFARFHGDSAWCVSADKGPGGYLEVDLGRITRLTWLGTQGYGKGYVSNYTIQYKRRKENKQWRPLVERLPQNITKLISLRGNSDTTRRTFVKLKGTRIVRYIRIILLDGVGKQWCLRLELYGCKWKNKDGLISYHSEQGNIRGVNETEVVMNDATYDGVAQFLGRRHGVLQGGLGQLTDGDVGGDAFWYDLGNGKSFEWVGWFDVINSKPAILFEFDSARQFYKIRLHSNNRPGNVKIFRNLLVAFSMDGQYFSRKFVFYPSSVLREKRNQSMWIEVDLRGHVGKYLNCEFSYDGKWIVLSEIEFESDPFNGLPPQHTKAVPPSTPSIKTEGKSMTRLISNPPSIKHRPSLKPVDHGPNEKTNLLSVPVIVGMVVVLVVLLVFIVVLLLWLKNRHGVDDDGGNPVRNTVRIVNPLNRDPLQNKKAKQSCSSSDSDEDVEELLQKKMNNFVPRSHTWYKSIDRYKKNNMNRVKYLKKECEIEEKEKESENVLV